MSCCDNGRGEDNSGLYLTAACINYFSSKLRLVFEGGLYLKTASIRYLLFDVSVHQPK